LLGQLPGGRLLVVVVDAVDVVVGALVTVTVLVLVLVAGGGTSTVVVTVEMLVVVEGDVVADPAAITPQATRLPELPAELPLKLSAVW
jgi:hypothetical protein